MNRFSGRITDPHITLKTITMNWSVEWISLKEKWRLITSLWNEKIDNKNRYEQGSSNWVRYIKIKFVKSENRKERNWELILKEWKKI